METINPFRDVRLRYQGHASQDSEFMKTKERELQGVKQEITLYEERIKKSSDRSVQMLIQSNEIATETEKELDRQGEALDRISSTLVEIKSDMKTAKKHVKSMSSVKGAVGNYLSKLFACSSRTRKEKRHRKAAILNNEPLKQAVRNTNPSRPDKSARNFDVNANMADNKRKTVGNDLESALDGNLDLMLRNLRDLKEHAELIGHTLDAHDVVIVKIGEQIDDNAADIHNSERKIRKMLHR